MTTITVDLERILASGKKNSYEGRAYADLVSCIARSKRVVCLTGAGISTSAGIPDFRSKDGLYKLASGSGATLCPSISASRASRSPSSSSSSSSSSSRPSSSSLAATSSLKGADLFSTQVFSSAASLSRFYRFISSLNTLSASAKPTPTHRFMRTLAQKGKLLRVYTQNIDGLEEKVGLTSANPSDYLSSGAATIPIAPSSTSYKGKSKFQGDLVHLHGRAALVRCTVCTFTGKWTDEVSQAYEAGYSMPCSQCQERLSLRKALGKRLNVAVGSLRPAITLYGEQGMEDLFISEISSADVRSRPDCLIIFGTSLKVHGFKQLAKDFAREVEENDGKVIYVNLTEPGKDWNSSIHYHVQGHTDIFVEAVLNEWRHIRPQDFEKQSKLSLSDFQPTKEKHSKLSTKEGKKQPDPDNVKKDVIKAKREERIARPVSPSKLRSSPARRPRYEDDDDYIVSSMKSSKTTDNNTKFQKQSSKVSSTTPTRALPSFKRISQSPSQAAIVSSDKKRKASTLNDSDSDSCELRTDEEEEDHKRSTSASRTSSPRRSKASETRAVKQKQAKLAHSRNSRRSIRGRDDFVISDSEQEGANSEYDDIPLIAELDSDDDEDTVYVQSSRTSTMAKMAERSLNKKSKSSAL